MLEKQLNIVDYALSSVWRRKTKVLGVMAVFSAVIFLIASFQMTTKALTDMSGTSLQYTPEITVQKMTAGRQESIPVTYIEKLNKIFGIRKIIPRVWGYYFDEANGANYTIIGVPLPDSSAYPQLPVTLQEGTLPGKGEVLLGQGVLKSMRLGERRIFSLFKPDLSLQAFPVSGVFSPDTDFFTFDTIAMHIEDSRELFGISQTMASDFCVYVANANEVATIAKKIADALPDTRVVTRQQIQKTYKAVFGWRSGFGSICILAALAAFVILAWDKASGLSPEEKKEIAILKVIGWQTADILTLRFWEAVTVSSLSFLIGFTCAYLHVSYFSAALFRPVLVGWSVIAPTLHLVPQLALPEILLIFSFTVIPYMAATVIPSWRCAVIPPDAAIN